MHVSIRTIAAAALVALLVPVAAVAKDARVKGPTALVGAGYYGGELELEHGGWSAARSDRRHAPGTSASSTSRAT